LKSAALKIIIFCLLLFAAGCASDVPKLHEIFPLPEGASCQVAVLPFMNRGHYPNGADLFYKVFSAQLVTSAKFQLINEGDLVKIYRQLMIFPTDMPSDEQMKIIANRLGVKMFISGDILRMNERRSGRQVYTELTLVIRFYDGESGKLLWETYHKRRGQDYIKVLHFGRINTLTGLARQMSDEIITLWFEKGMPECLE